MAGSNDRAIGVVTGERLGGDLVARAVVEGFLPEYLFVVKFLGCYFARALMPTKVSGGR